MTLTELLKGECIAPIVSFNPGRDLLQLGLGVANEELTPELVADTRAFSAWVDEKRKITGARYGIGGYDEVRMIYGRSTTFDDAEEPRRLHIGLDIWGPAGTIVFSPLAGKLHSFKNNAAFGDYGPTIILQHKIKEQVFYTLYGHLSLESLEGLMPGQAIAKGQELAGFGDENVNGNWPPHLHFQVVMDIGGYKGDYPGVCKQSEREQYLRNCPDPKPLTGLLY